MCNAAARLGSDAMTRRMNQGNEVFLLPAALRGGV
jgi:hypothetical protein